MVDRARVSEKELQGELNLAIGATADLGSILAGDGLASAPEIGIGSSASRWRCRCRRGDSCTDATVGISKVRMVEDVENISSKLNFQLFLPSYGNNYCSNEVISDEFIMNY